MRYRQLAESEMYTGVYSWALEGGTNTYSSRVEVEAFYDKVLSQVDQ